MIRFVFKEGEFVAMWRGEHKLGRVRGKKKVRRLGKLAT